jgi:D-sedoheptulose 7-phosphate isomerase
MSLVENPASELETYFQKSEEIAKGIRFQECNLLIEKLIRVRESEARVFLAGNGGSATTAQHFAVDIGVGLNMRSPGQGLNAFFLSPSIAAMSATSNDFSFDEVFESQLLLSNPNPSDLIIVFSASGNSSNIIKLLKCAKRGSISTCAFTGFDGGLAKLEADLSIHIESEKGEYGIIEDLHLKICHAITNALRNRIK